MPRRPNCPIKETPSGWCLDLSAGVSETGQRQRLFFDTKGKAQVERRKRLDKLQEHGRNAVNIPPDLAAEATKCNDRLSSLGVSLTEAVNYYVQYAEKKAASRVFVDAWQDYVKSKEGKSAVYLRDHDRFENSLPEWFKKLTVAEIGREEAERALDECTNGNVVFNGRRRLLNAFFGWAVRRELCERNVVQLVDKRHVDRQDVDVYTPDELQSIFTACLDYRDSYDESIGSKANNRLDCRQCAVAFAFLAFAGIRPHGEFSRLIWSDVSLELRNIRLRSQKSKTKTIRNIRIEDTLAAWIATVPESERVGPIMPSQWEKKRGKVLKEAGLLHRQQDILRHSYGTYHLAVFRDMEALRENMGHSHATTYYRHYHKAVTKREALPWWNVLPEGVEASLVKVV